MTTVREATFELFRAHGMTTIFGNPGSTELPMLADFPDDFSYVLGLQELVVVGMADGYAQASGRPAHVNLHTAPGVGNAVGGIFNAQANKSPLVITAGQQVRPQITFEANLTNRDAVVGPQPYVKYSHEPPRAQDVPAAVARAIYQRHAAAARPHLRLDPDGRLGRRRRRGSRRPRPPARRQRTDGARSRGADRARRPARRRPLTGAGGRPRHRRRRCLERRGGAGREAAPAGVGQPGDRRLAPRFSREPPSVSGHPASGHRPPLRDAQGARPGGGRRLVSVSLLPLSSGSPAGRRQRAGGDHQRPRRRRLAPRSGDAIVGDVRAGARASGRARPGGARARAAPGPPGAR